jgi:hydroxymethylglutaryl-CoA reductase
MIAQIQLLDQDPEKCIAILNKNKLPIISKGNEFISTIVKRGGGIRDMQAYSLDPIDSTPYHNCKMTICNLYVDVKEAMGANIVNTLSERISPFISEITGARTGLCILSNLSETRLTKAYFEVPITSLKWKGVQGEEVAARLIQAYEFARRDVHRAVTHNKGIMNGIDAVAVATGQDWRALEASCHAYASFSMLIIRKWNKRI